MQNTSDGAILGVHVNDIILAAADDQERKRVKQAIAKLFGVKIWACETELLPN